MEGCTCYDHLSADLLDEILKRLPLKNCVRAAAVCKAWHDVVTSRLMPEQCLLLCSPKPCLPSLLFSFSATAAAWQRIPVSLPVVENVVLHRGSAAGMLLLDAATSNTLQGPPTSYVCNPLTGRSLALPPRRHVTKALAKGITTRGGRAAGFLVAVIGREEEAGVVAVEVFDSGGGAKWKRVGALPDTVAVTAGNMVFSEGHVFCLTKSRCRRTFEAMTWIALQDGAVNEVAVPAEVASSGCWAGLVGVAGRVLLVEALEDPQWRLKEVAIWEYSVKYARWILLAKMPKRVVDEMRGSYATSWCAWMECVGVANKVCLRGHDTHRIASFDVITRQWGCLPPCPLGYRFVYLTSMAFHPSSVSPDVF